MINNFDINILVNGNRCKIYNHNGKFYIEAKHDSQYELEIKNNTWQRSLVLASVDGLNVLSGETATDEDSGYVIQSQSPLRIKGFRYSNNEVASFKFTNKNNSYAQSVGGSEAAKNCGVIGFKIFNEYFNLSNYYLSNQFTPSPSIPQYPNMDFDYNKTILRSANCSAAIGARSLDSSNQSLSYNSAVNCVDFDMGSTWGQKIESKVTEIPFERGALVYSVDIYYASRQSLIDMGVPINTGNQVSFPQSFPKKYATPPKNWVG